MGSNFFASRQKEFKYELVVTQGDITPYGSASFINYVRWLNIARDALLLWSNLGLDSSLKSSIETEVSTCNIQYKREAMLQDEIIIKINSAEITANEFTLLFTILRKSDALLISLGKQRLRFRDSKTGSLLDLTQTLIKDILKPIQVEEKTLLFKY